MFYFIYGDTPLLLKYEEVLKEIKTKEGELPTKIYDISQGEEESFLQSISINSMFSPKELIILKRVEEIKKLENFLKVVSEYNLSQKEVVLLYEEKLNDYGKATNEVSEKILKIIDELGKKVVARKALERKSIDFYIEKELNISEYEAENLSEILGDDFIKVKNEVEKIKNFIGNEGFILEEVIPILSVSKEYNLKKLVEEFISENKYKELLEYLKMNREYMLFIYLLSDELVTLMKLKELVRLGALRDGITYNSFKGECYSEIKKYFKNSRGYIKEYPLFLKLPLLKKYSSDFLYSKIEELLKIESQIKSGKIEEEIGVEKIIIGFIK